jgi:hypothetical protein
MRHILKKDVLKQVDMEMNNVELIGEPPYPIEHDRMRGEMAVDARKT